MSPSFKLQCHFILIFLVALRGESYLELWDTGDHDPFLLFSANLKLELAGEQLYRCALRCVDMLRIQGQSFTADQPQLHCTAFFVSESAEFITVHYDLVSIHGQGGNFLKVFDGWILKEENFPSSQDHPFPMTEQCIDFCESGLRKSIRSFENVVMIFFWVHEPGNGCTLAIRIYTNLFHYIASSENVILVFLQNLHYHFPDPNWKVPHQLQNCSFFIIYSVVIKTCVDLTLGHVHDLQLKNPSVGCEGKGDFVEPGGTGLDPSKMTPLADLCYPFCGPAQMKIGCDNKVVCMVSSRRYINSVNFEYHQLAPELENSNKNSIEEFCLSGL
ncbi:LOW QUALITY PROTEIN: corticotropin-releasing factor-binding protein [Rhynchonycteris naso]